MAKTKAKTQIRNPERRSHKAWGKDHNPNPTAEQIQKAQERAARRAEKRAAREKRAIIRHDRGLPITPPEITWGWFGDMLASRWPMTRKARVLDNHAALGKAAAKPEDGVPVVSVMDNTEAKPSRKAAASSRKNGK